MSSRSLIHCGRLTIQRLTAPAEDAVTFGWHSTHWNIEMSPRLIGCLKGSLALWQVSHFRSDRPPRSIGCWMGIDSGVVEGRAESDKTVWQMLQSFRITFPVLLTCSPS